MTSPTLSEPCAPWPLDATCLPAGWNPVALTPEQTASVKVASEILWRLSGGQFGLCEIILRPCRRGCIDTNLAYWANGVFVPYVMGGEWFNLTCCGQNSCGCGPICELELPGPVHAITSVTVDGVVVPADTYRVDNAAWLVRLGDACWPDCQSLNLEPDQVGTFAVTYQKGVPVPPGGSLAVTQYAVELWKACNGVSGCKLPARVQSVTREGVSMTMLDPMTFLQDGLTGLPFVDQWLTAVNPYGSRSPSQVFSIDVPTPRRQTWP